MKRVKPPSQPEQISIGGAEDHDDGPTNLLRYTGTTNVPFSRTMVNAVQSVLWLPVELEKEQRQERIKAAFAAIEACQPKDAVEGMLASQAVAMHAASMECFRRAMHPGLSFELAARYRKDGASMARGMVEMLDALDRKRGKGTRQVVRVEKVMVAAGGQAVVGNIAAGGPGGGPDGKTAEEPHTPPTGLAYDTTHGPIGSTMRGEDSARVPMPGASHGKR